MAPKSSLLSHQPSKDDQSSSSTEQEEEEEDDETVAESFDNHESSDSDSDSPCDYVLQPIPVSKGSSKRSRGDVDQMEDSSSKSLKIEEKRSAFTRVWSEEDEIAVLNGLAEFKMLDNPNNNGDFHSFIKGKLKVDFSKDQLRSKISRLKRRFSNALRKADNPVFSKPHEDLVFKISDKIWGTKKIVGNVVHVKKKESDENESERERGDFWSKYPNIAASFEDMKANYPSLPLPFPVLSWVKEKLSSSIENVKAKELDDKWKQLAVEKVKLDYKMLMLMKEQLQMVLDH